MSSPSKTVIRRWHKSLSQVMQLRADKSTLALLSEVDRLEAILDEVPSVNNTILGMKSRALIAEIRGDWSTALTFREMEVGALLNALALQSSSGLNSVGRQVHSEAGGSIDDTLDEYEPEEIVEEWCPLVWLYCDLNLFDEAFDVIDAIERFARVHAVEFDAEERRIAVKELAGI